MIFKHYEEIVNGMKQVSELNYKDNPNEDNAFAKRSISRLILMINEYENVIKKYEDMALKAADNIKKLNRAINYVRKYVGDNIWYDIAKHLKLLEEVEGEQNEDNNAKCFGN